MTLDDPLFAPDNLKRLAEARMREDSDTDSSPGFIQLNQVPPLHFSSLIGIDDHLTVPISFETNLDCELKIKATCHFNLKANLKELKDAYQIPNRNQRILKIRQILRFETQDCELKFSP